ncbi:MAG TPA: protoporphyrinogen oxidase [Thermoanaerobaculia bacterium]|nr:protoporphyrinogen oxidase [Thermoanaerobaculia bacterium]
MSDATAVVGAGLSGLTAARALARAGRPVVVFEESGRPGGAVRSEARGGFLIELGPNTVRPTPELWRLVEELGLARQALFAPASLPRYVELGGRLHALPASPPAFVASRLLSVAGKLRLLSEPLRPRRRANAEESVHAFAARRLGAQVADRMIEPFVGGVYAGSADALEVSAAFPSLARWERERGSILRGALADRRRRPAGPRPPRGLLSFREGLEALPRALATELGDSLRLNAAIRGLKPSKDGWTLETSDGAVDAARVVLAVPAWRAAELVAGFAPEAAAALGAIPHPPLAVLHLAYAAASLPRPLHGFGHLVVPDPARRILGAVWSSSLFTGRAPDGQVLLTVFAGGTRDPDAAGLSDSELAGMAARDLAGAGVASGAPTVVAITRWRRAIPQYTFGHGERIRVLEHAEARWPGLRFAGNYRGGVSVGDVVKSGMEAGS